MTERRIPAAEKQRQSLVLQYLAENPARWRTVAELHDGPLAPLSWSLDTSYRTVRALCLAGLLWRRRRDQGRTYEYQRRHQEDRRP